MPLALAPPDNYAALCLRGLIYHMRGFFFLRKRGKSIIICAVKLRGF